MSQDPLAMIDRLVRLAVDPSVPVAADALKLLADLASAGAAA